MYKLFDKINYVVNFIKYITSKKSFDITINKQIVDTTNSQYPFRMPNIKHCVQLFECANTEIDNKHRIKQ